MTPRVAAIVVSIPLLLAPSLLGTGLAAAAQAQGRSGGTPAASDRERYLELVKKKERMQKLNALWKVEADLSAKRTAYAVLDLSERKLYFKVRGRAFKAVSFTGLEIARPSGSGDPEDLAWRAFTLQVKEGKGVETETIQRKTLTPEEAKMSGREAEDEPIGAEQGVVESGSDAPAASGSSAGSGAPATQKMAGVAGGLIPPDPPRKYHLGFDGELSIWVEADVSLPGTASRYESFLPLARAIGRLFVGGAEKSGDTRLTIHVPLDRGQQIYRQLLPGQRLLLTL